MMSGISRSGGGQLLYMERILEDSQSNTYENRDTRYQLTRLDNIDPVIRNSYEDIGRALLFAKHHGAAHTSKEEIEQEGVGTSLNSNFSAQRNIGQLENAIRKANDLPLSETPVYRSLGAIQQVADDGFHSEGPLEDAPSAVLQMMGALVVNCFEGAHYSHFLGPEAIAEVKRLQQNNE